MVVHLGLGVREHRAYLTKMSVEIHTSPENSPTMPSEANCTPLSIHRIEDLNDKFKEKLNEALSERDEMWRKHEKEQIAYVQQQTSQMLARLHNEIERLMGKNRDLERRLHVSNIPDPEVVEELENKIENLQKQNKSLKKEFAASEDRNKTFAKTLEETARVYRDQVYEHENKIRQLTHELDQRTLTMTQLSTQIRNYKLREAMAQAQQRRRASCIDPPNTTTSMTLPSPVKPKAFRLFGATQSAVESNQNKVQNKPEERGLKPPNTSSVQKLPYIGSPRRSDIQNSIEKPVPSMVRSMSAGIPPTKPHLLYALRNAQNLTTSSSFDASN
ncbi:unnamed protein product [Bursaphelenchus xylophilus]|uniref:(pine wood nematode) hypothetical protein n=1 Tax=Bursaphelenchus xylophilus TaxID=6326 RepID=A0A1I7SQW0_BURXY|nr:unnamed protein product [Bursaphelenchus xylophilus]CAG9110469.1 unnamed protein product [Bursaphelenchus xylophilus]